MNYPRTNDHRHRFMHRVFPWTHKQHVPTPIELHRKSVYDLEKAATTTVPSLVGKTLKKKFRSGVPREILVVSSMIDDDDDNVSVMSEDSCFDDITVKSSNRKSNRHREPITVVNNMDDLLIYVRHLRKESEKRDRQLKKELVDYEI